MSTHAFLVKSPSTHGMVMARDRHDPATSASQVSHAKYSTGTRPGALRSCHACRRVCALNTGKPQYIFTFYSVTSGRLAEIPIHQLGWDSWEEGTYLGDGSTARYYVIRQKFTSDCNSEIAYHPICYCPSDGASQPEVEEPHQSPHQSGRLPWEPHPAGGIQHRQQPEYPALMPSGHRGRQDLLASAEEQGAARR